MEVNVLDSALAMHDALLRNVPADARHESDACPLCTDWAMTDEGIPSGASRLEFADAAKPYGDVKYADPGYQADKVRRYPVDTEVHAQAAWTYIHQEVNAAKYTAEQLATMRSTIAAALKKFGIEAEEKEANKGQVQKPASNSDSKTGKPSASGKAKSDAAVEGGTKHMATEDSQDTMLRETHEALLHKAVKDSTTALEAEKASLTEQVAQLTAALATRTEELASAVTENERINSELDTAQVALTAARDEASQLKADIAAKEAEATKAEIASARAAQVRNLGLFEETFITDRASRWADMEEAAWNERLEEWKVAKGTSPAPGKTAKTTETASAITGTRDTQVGGEPSARRAVLGLASSA